MSSLGLELSFSVEDCIMVSVGYNNSNFIRKFFLLEGPDDLACHGSSVDETNSTDS